MAFLLIENTHSELNQSYCKDHFKDKLKCYLKTAFHARTLRPRELARVMGASYLCSSFVKQCKRQVLRK